MKIYLKDNILHIGDRQLHRPCHHSDQQTQVPAQSSLLRQAKKEVNKGKTKKAKQKVHIRKK